MDITGILRTIAGSLQTPVVTLLVILMAVTLVLAGTLTAEFFIERRFLRVGGRTLPKLADAMHENPLRIKHYIEDCCLLKRQKDILTELTEHGDISASERESIAVRLLEREQARYDRRVKVTDLIAKTGPMLGLMGTLIPLGPGIIALGQGDTYTLSNSLLVAFDTTIAGLVCAFVALYISAVRKSWYRNYMSVLEMLTECVLEEEEKKGLRREAAL